MSKTKRVEKINYRLVKKKYGGAGTKDGGTHRGVKKAQVWF
jgi:hypothetical protein|tara:strand:- start:1148 stop:1270 length:123 start_codon:yes stop_codon:yes gene_type:complete